MNSEERFPQELLSAPTEQRLSYFRDKIVAHPRLVTAFNELIETIYQPGDVSIIFVFGPTGVGKTTLRLRTEKRLIEDALPGLDRDLARVPVASVEAIAQGADNFHWRDYYHRALSVLDEPLLMDKVDYNERYIGHDNQGRMVIDYRASASELRRALEKCLVHRRLTAFMVDEAQHLKKIPGGRRLLDQMDSLKSLSSLGGTRHVLLGTYELLALTDLSAQLNRRSLDIHLARYRVDCPEEVIAFKAVLWSFQRALPLAEEPELLAHYDYLYEGSVGCVGLLKEWLSRALVQALKNEQRTLTLKNLERSATPMRKLLRYAREIKEGEERLRERQEQRAELRALLGLEPTPVEQTAAEPGTSRQPRRVGERKPVRDLVGVV